MPKHFRKCDFCLSDTTKNPEMAFFKVNENLKKVLDISEDVVRYICESHFDACDIRDHGGHKRLCDDAVPVSLPMKEAVFMDHSYVMTAPLDMVNSHYI